jgi:hypothetical protein
MSVNTLSLDQWPWGFLLPGIELVGQDEIDRHDRLRDHLADGINAAPGGGAAVTEISLTAAGSRIRADADIIAKAPRSSEASHTLFEVKTGPYADIRWNQQYVYALALVGGHVSSASAKLAKVGLAPLTQLPAMDFLLVAADPPDFKAQFYLIRASEVNGAATLALVMARIAALEAKS